MNHVPKQISSIVLLILDYKYRHMFKRIIVILRFSHRFSVKNLINFEFLCNAQAIYIIFRRFIERQRYSLGEVCYINF